MYTSRFVCVCVRVVRHACVTIEVYKHIRHFMLAFPVLHVQYLGGGLAL